MKLNIRKTSIPGCVEIAPYVAVDKRGRFVKTFHAEAFTAEGLETTYAEDYYSLSTKGVIRGMHFQTPPMDHVKLVYCVRGMVLDAVVDIREGSPAYGKYELFELSAEKANMIYIPSGLAHGFYVKSEEAILLYKVGSLYSPAHDAGLRWDSVGIPWPDKNPIVSERDSKFTALKDFKSPFIYKP